MFRTIILAHDGSEGSSRALPAAVELARVSGGRLLVTHARTHTIETAIEAQLEQLVEDLQADGIQAELILRTSVAGSEGTLLADVAREEAADVIVISNRGRSPLAGAVLGSVTQRLLQVAPCRVLVVPAVAAEAELAAEGPLI